MAKWLALQRHSAVTAKLANSTREINDESHINEFA